MIQKKPQILIVDDNMKNLQLLVNVLEINNFETAVATNGFEALQYFDTETTDLILLDIMMPGMDGYQVCDELKNLEKAKQIPIIFLTAKMDGESIIKGFDHGGVDYVTKPFNESELIARVKTHVELKLSKDELFELNKNKDKFFSIIAHDLKNPLLGLISLSETLLDADKNDSPLISEIAEMLHDIVMNQYKLLENLLEWASLQTKQRKIIKEKFMVNDAIEEIIELYEPIAKNKQIELKFETHTQKLVAFADERMMETVLRNLVSNAIKFTPEKGSVNIRLEKADGKLIISVADTGVGMRAEDVEKVFKTNENFSTQGTNQEKGTGIGLILCHELVELNKGKMTAESEPGKGSVFTVEIPAIDN